MASAEKLLQEAQYAFASITFGESRGNTRNRSRAKSLSNKIIRKYPGTMEAGEAHALLRRLGEEAYTSNLQVRHQHTSRARHHKKTRKPVSPETRTFVTEVSDDVALNWAGLLLLIFKAPKFLLAILIAGGLFLFGLVGPVLFAPLLVLVLLLGPAKPLLNGRQRAQVNQAVARLNEWINERNRS